jgi:hypothetical protein
MIFELELLKRCFDVKMESLECCKRKENENCIEINGSSKHKTWMKLWPEANDDDNKSQNNL